MRKSDVGVAKHLGATGYSTRVTFNRGEKRRDRFCISIDISQSIHRNAKVLYNNTYNSSMKSTGVHYHATMFPT